ncbi:MAG TPA: NAD(P)H-binding protein [Promineifilum sp.]
MKRLLVTGGTGVLGSQVVRRAAEAGWTVRSLSRGSKPAHPAGEWVQADLVTGQGVEEAVRGIDVIIHCASLFGREQPASAGEGSAPLLAAARRAGVANFIYTSIAGTDRSHYGYYLLKTAEEKALASSGVPHTIIRLTQFHSLVETVLGSLSRRFGQLSPCGWRFQPLAPEDAADLLIELAKQPAAGRAPDAGGPEIRTLDSLAESWMEITGARKRLIHLPSFGSLSKAWSTGINLTPDNPAGSVTWEQWLRGRHERPG